MADASRDFADLKREIVEARNQAIKTDNVVKNLSLDVKGFEKRFDGLERRTRTASFGAIGVIAFVIAVAAAMVSEVRVRGVQEELTAARAEAASTEEAAQERVEELRGKLALAAQERRQREKAEEALGELLEKANGSDQSHAAALLNDLKVEHLSPLIVKLVGEDLEGLRRQAAETAYRVGRGQLGEGRVEAGVVELRKSLQLDPDGRFAGPARYLVATSLWHTKRFEEAIPYLEQLREGEGRSDATVMEEVRYYLGTALAYLGKDEKAKEVLRSLVKSSGRHRTVGLAYLAALESGGTLPEVPEAPARILRQ